MNKLHKHSLKGCLLAFLVGINCATTAYAQQVNAPSLITVTGQAEVRVPPDEVVFTLEIEFTDKDLLVAKNKTDESVKQVFAIARKHKINQDDIQTSYISVEPKYNTDDLDYEQRRRVKKEFVGYEVSKTTVIRLHDISRFDELLSDVLKAGVSKIGNLEFRDSQIRKHKDQARTMAVKAAQEKAILLTREIGQSIGPAFSITEGAGSYPSNNLSQNATSVISGDLSASEGAFSPGLISVTALVTVSFKLQ
jgi:uncharacterized protein